MKKNMKCLACGRKRKPSHEKRCGTPKAYSPECETYEDFDYQEYKVALAQKIIDSLKEAEKLVNDAKAEIQRVEEINAKVEAEAKTTGGIETVETTCAVPTPEQVEKSVVEACQHTANLVDQANA